MKVGGVAFPWLRGESETQTRDSQYAKFNNGQMVLILINFFVECANLTLMFVKSCAEKRVNDIWTKGYLVGSVGNV